MKKVKIKAPVEGFTGKRGQVAFVDGVGETDDPAMVAYFRRHGYGVAGEEPPAEPPAQEFVTGAERPTTAAPTAEKAEATEADAKKAEAKKSASRSAKKTAAKPAAKK